MLPNVIDPSCSLHINRSPWFTISPLQLTQCPLASSDLPCHIVLEQNQDTYIYGTHFLAKSKFVQGQIYPLCTSPPIHEKLFMDTWRIVPTLSLRGQTGNRKWRMQECFSLHAVTLILRRPVEVNSHRCRHLMKIQEALVGRAMTTSSHLSFVPDLLVASAGPRVSLWQYCCSRRRTAPSPGGSCQYLGSVCTQDSLKTASHCPGLQPNYTTCPVRKKWTVFGRLEIRVLKSNH